MKNIGEISEKNVDIGHGQSGKDQSCVKNVKKITLECFFSFLIQFFVFLYFSKKLCEKCEKDSPWSAVGDGGIEVCRVHDIFGQRLIIGYTSVLKSETYSTDISFQKIWATKACGIFMAHLNPQMISLGRYEVRT